VGGGVVSVQHKANRARARAIRRRKQRPPWGDILGGKPIPGAVWNFNKKVDLGDKARVWQHARMLRLKDYYGIEGRVSSYPISGVVPADWLPWYQLALAIASDLDDSLKIIDPARPRKTAPRWRGLEGEIMLTLVHEIHAAFPKRPVRWCIARFQKAAPEYGRMPLDELVVRYYEAKRHHRATKRVRK